MSLTLYLECFLVALVGMTLQTILKIKSIQQKAIAANIKFAISDYFKQDWGSILASFVTVVLFLLILDDILKWQPSIVNYVKIGFAFVGWTGSDLANRLFSVIDGKIRDIIDTKANKADGVQVPVTSIK